MTERQSAGTAARIPTCTLTISSGNIEDVEHSAVGKRYWID